MTTIAANLEMMAADSRVVIDETSYLSPKLVKLPDAIIGAAGDAEACHMFFEWWPKRDEDKFSLPKGLDVEALVLTKDGLYRYGEFGRADKIRDGIMAIGTGSAIAMASMDTMLKLGLAPDPRIAVEVACKRNPGSSLPVDYFVIEKPKRKRK